MGNFRIYYRGTPKDTSSLTNDFVKKTYHGIIIGANLAAYYKFWAPAFLRDLSKPFFIDPQTYAFQMPRNHILREDGELRKSYSVMSEKYGKMTERIILLDKRELTPDDFDDKNGIEDFVKSTMAFQKELLISLTSTQKSFSEWDEILGYPKDTSDLISKYPEFLVVPYFYFTNTDDPWYDVNLRLLSIAKRLFGDGSRYAVICTEKEVLAQGNEVDKIVEDYSDMDGVIVWFSNFNELQEEKDTFKAYINFLKRFQPIDIISLYGGYFSLLALKFGLKGSVSGIGVGEYKDVREPYLGGGPPGGPTIRYHIPQAKTRCVVADAISFYQSNPTALCECEICSKLFQEASGDIDEFFLNLTDEQAKAHYCLCKNADSNYIEEHSLLDTHDKMRNDLNFCNDKINRVYNIKYRHLERWLSVLDDMIVRNHI